MIAREEAMSESEKNAEKIGEKIAVKINEKIKVWKVIVAFFVIGIAMGACTLGMKLPVALFELATGQPT